MKLIRTTLESPAAQLYFMGCCSWLLLLAMGSGCTQQEPTSGVPQELASKAQPALVRLPALPARQEVRVNDTLVLVCSQPYTTLPQYPKPSLVLWSHLALRGRRGYEEVLSEADPLLLYCLYQCHDEALVSAQGSVLHFSVLDVGRIPWTEVRRGQPLPDRAVYALDSWVWDVRYRVPASYMSADLKELNLRDAPCFTGGMAGDSIPEEYHVLPHWINQELAQLKRRHRLPRAHPEHLQPRPSHDTGLGVSPGLRSSIAAPAARLAGLSTTRRHGAPPRQEHPGPTGCATESTVPGTLGSSSTLGSQLVLGRRASSRNLSTPHVYKMRREDGVRRPPNRSRTGKVPRQAQRPAVPKLALIPRLGLYQTLCEGTKERTATRLKLVAVLSFVQLCSAVCQILLIA